MSTFNHDWGYCVSLIPSHEHGIARLVEWCQVDSTRSTQDDYNARPYIRNALDHSCGWLDVLVDWIDAPMFFVSAPRNMNEHESATVIRGVVAEELKSLVEQPCLQLAFSGRLYQDTEAKQQVWRTISHQQEAIGQLCTSARDIFARYGFETLDKNAPAQQGQVYITIRGRWPNDGTTPDKPPKYPFNIVFDKLGVTKRFCSLSKPTRFEKLENKRRPNCGSTLSLNFGPLTEVIDPGSTNMTIRYSVSGQLSVNQTKKAKKRQQRQAAREELAPLPEDAPLQQDEEAAL